MLISRRQTIGSLVAVPFMTSCATRKTGWDVIVIGAGVFGAWTAENLRRSGKKVLLVDAWGPANTRASSGGETRMTRGGYGSNKIYSEMAKESLVEWMKLSAKTDLPLFHNTGTLIFFDVENDYARESYDTLKALNISVERFEPPELKKMWPQVNWSGVSFGLHEPEFGALMARRGIATLVGEFIRKGGSYRQAGIKPPKSKEDFTFLETNDGVKLQADSYVFACGVWLAKLFPEILGERLFATKQEIFYFRPRSGDSRFKAESMPGWADFIGDKIYYGFPDIENRGFKIADDSHGPIINYDANDRIPSQDNLNAVRQYMANRFPGLEAAPLSEVRVCQYGNSANGDFLIDKHPQWPNVTLVGMGSGHGFKHGPAVGKRVANLVLNNVKAEPRFSLNTKVTRQERTVH